LKPDRRLILALSLLTAGCDQAMSEQPKRDPLRPSSFFADGRSSRTPVPGTIAQGQLRLDDHLYRGRVGAGFAATFPSPVTIAVLERGRERYDIFCAPCHDRTGSGRGMIVERGYRAPPSFHIDRLRQAPQGYLFNVITRGFSAMPDYAEQISVRDRWSIVAYLRALQLSQDTRKEELPPEERQKLEAETP